MGVSGSFCFPLIEFVYCLKPSSPNFDICKEFIVVKSEIPLFFLNVNQVSIGITFITSFASLSQAKNLVILIQQL